LVNGRASNHWRTQDLQELVRENLQGCQLIVVSNREPYIHRYSGERVECIQPASGMVAAIDPIMRAAGGIWIAHGSGSADRQTVDRCDRICVPASEPSYLLRRVWLTEAQQDAYYCGLANEGLWPLCHIAFTRPVFRPEDWRCYREVNELFARAVLEEAGSKPTLVFIQDYHFALLPRILKNLNPSLILAQFWHIPWPNREVFRAFPWGEQLLDGMLGNDLLGFHLSYHCQNFLDTVDRSIEAKVDQEKAEITRGGRTTLVRSFPIGIDFERQTELAASEAVDGEVERWRQRLGLGGRIVGVGIDRMDYTKGIPERLRALDRFLELNPSYCGRVVFVQVGVPSREKIPRYQELSGEISALAEEINWRWGTGSWQPVMLIREHLGPLALAALYRLAHFCFVSSLHDGMNLVAKEFVASRWDEQGVLILSRFTGASRQLSDALLVNPFSPEETADAIQKAVEMAPEEQRWRMQRMRDAVAGHNVYRWACEVLSALADVRAAARQEQWEEAVP
jgi:trehalose 6-phosphate synthase